jgi:hypothetical protein
LVSTNFWNSLPLLKEENNILHFTVIPTFFPDVMKSLLIRQSYVGLFQRIIDNLNNFKFHRMAITGNPGIGKSLFLFYIMWRISSMSSVGSVILHRAKDRGLIYVFENERCWRTRNLGDIDEALFLSNTWYLTDTLDPIPGEVKAVTILVSSPSEKHYNEFLKYPSNDSLRYLPVWTLEELMQAAPLYQLSTEVVERRYCIIGGIPRYVLEKSSEDLIPVINSAVAKLNIEKFHLIASGLLSKEEEISHRIVHYVVDESFNMTTLQFSSSYTTEKALELFSKYQHQNLCNFILYSEHSTISSGLRGNLFEAFAHRLLSNGGTYDCRSLDDGEKRCISLTALVTDRFTDIKKCIGGKYFIPWNPNYPCIDSIIRNSFLFQMTVSNFHPINGSKMAEIMSDTKLKELYFVVPRSSFENFQKQRVDEKKESAKNETNQNRELDLKQYVLAIDIK